MIKMMIMWMNVSMKMFSHGNEYEDEEEEAKEAPVSKEVNNYLSVRERLKDKHRSIRVDNSAFSSNNSLKNFGSFFGPSKPVIAQRVIQESMSLIETRHLNLKASTSQNDVKKFGMTSSVGLKDAQRNRPPVKQVKTKAQIIKDTRDYSFLSSDNTDGDQMTGDNGCGKTLPSNFGCKALNCGSLRPSASEKRKPSSGMPQFRAAKTHMEKPPKLGAVPATLEKQKPGSENSVHDAPATPNKVHKYTYRRAPDTSIDEEFDYRSEIRSLFGYRPSQYDDDDDDTCMEVGFDTIQSEELRSARIARKEDEIELAKIMEEEKQERLRKKARKHR